MKILRGVAHETREKLPVKGPVEEDSRVYAIMTPGRLVGRAYSVERLRPGLL